MTGMITRARSEQGLTAESMVLSCTCKNSPHRGPCLGPWHDGRWVVVKTASGRVLRWIEADAPDAALQLAAFGQREWHELAA